MNTAAAAIAGGRSKVVSRLSDYAQLTKSRVTTLIVVTAWCGFWLGAEKAGMPVIGWSLFHALLGIGMVSSGSAALNEALESDLDRKMRRTKSRPIPAGRMSLLHATVIGLLLTLGGLTYPTLFTNRLTGALAFLTSAVYLLGYTPLKRVSPICTFVGAFPGAMPGVLGWTAACNRLSWGALALFAIVFLWQFPHFFSIAWLYSEDYARAGIHMLPVEEPDGRSTRRRIFGYSLALIPVSLAPSVLSITGLVYAAGALLLGVLLFYCGTRLNRLDAPIHDALARTRARQLFLCTIVYLPVLFALMMSDAVRS